MLMVSSADPPITNGGGVIPILIDQKQVQACVNTLSQLSGDDPLRSLLGAIVRAWVQIPR
jgi:hypothetical protein